MGTGLGFDLEILKNSPRKFAQLATSFGQQVRYFRSFKTPSEKRDFNDNYVGFSQDTHQHSGDSGAQGRQYAAGVDFDRLLVSQIRNEKMRDKLGYGEIGDMLLTVPRHRFDGSVCPYVFEEIPIYDTIGEGDKVVLLNVKRRVEDVIQREKDYRLRDPIFVQSILDVRTINGIVPNANYALTDGNFVDFGDTPIKGKPININLDSNAELKKVGGAYIQDDSGNPDQLRMEDEDGNSFILSFKENVDKDHILHTNFVGHFEDSGKMKAGTIKLFGEFTTVTNVTIVFTGNVTFFLASTSVNEDIHTVQYLLQPSYIVFKDVGMDRIPDQVTLPKRFLLKKIDFPT